MAEADEPSDAGSPWKEGHLADRAPNVLYPVDIEDAFDAGMPLESGIRVDKANAAELAAAGCPAAAERLALTCAAPPVTATPNDKTAERLEAEEAVLGKVGLDLGPSDAGPGSSGSSGSLG